MESERAYYVGTHRHSFRPGKPAEIIGVVFVNPPDDTPRACFHVRYEDGAEDWNPICDTYNYKIVRANTVEYVS